MLQLGGNGNIDGTGNSANNLIIGNGGNNVLAGGGGNDALSGGDGNDTYVFGLGDGNDQIGDSSGTDRLLITVPDFAGMSAARTGTNGLDLTLTFDASNSVDIVSQFDGMGGAVESLVDVTDGITYAIAQGLTGTAGNDLIVGDASNRMLSGGAGNDLIFGDPDDTLIGGTGNDTLFGGDGNDSTATCSATATTRFSIPRATIPCRSTTWAAASTWSRGPARMGRTSPSPCRTAVRSSCRTSSPGRATKSSSVSTRRWTSPTPCSRGWRGGDGNDLIVGELCRRLARRRRFARPDLWRRRRRHDLGRHR